jgi:hypothetical protein
LFEGDRLIIAGHEQDGRRAQRRLPILGSMALGQTDCDRRSAAIMAHMDELTPGSELFKGRPFDQEIIVLWSLASEL